MLCHAVLCSVGALDSGSFRAEGGWGVDCSGDTLYSPGVLLQQTMQLNICESAMQNLAQQLGGCRDVRRLLGYTGADGVIAISMERSGTTDDLCKPDLRKGLALRIASLLIKFLCERKMPSIPGC